MARPKSFEIVRGNGYIGGWLNAIIVKRESKCGCQRVMKPGELCLQFTSAGTYPTRICRMCCKKLAKLVQAVAK